MQAHSVNPSPRHDVLVHEAASGQPRRMTHYSGVVWLRPPPQPTEVSVLGIKVTAHTGMSASMRPNDPLQFVLPDGLAYRKQGLASAVVSASAGLVGFQDTTASREYTLVLSTSVTFLDDPQRPERAWPGVTVALFGSVWAVSYHVVVTVPTDAVA